MPASSLYLQPETSNIFPEMAYLVYAAERGVPTSHARRRGRRPVRDPAPDRNRGPPRLATVMQAADRRGSLTWLASSIRTLPTGTQPGPDINYAKYFKKYIASFLEASQCSTPKLL